MLYGVYVFYDRAGSSCCTAYTCFIIAQVHHVVRSIRVL